MHITVLLYVVLMSCAGAG